MSSGMCPFLFAEFLKARIIPERIEHRIEPDQRRCERRKLSEKFALFLWREGYPDNFDGYPPY
jgi:hypothetical protein